MESENEALEKNSGNNLDSQNSKLIIEPQKGILRINESEKMANLPRTFRPPCFDD